MNNYFENLRHKLEHDFTTLQNPPKFTLSKKKIQPLRTFTFFSSEKKLSTKGETPNSQNSVKTSESQFLTPMLMRPTSNHIPDKDVLRRTNWKSEHKSQADLESPGFLNKYLSANGLRKGHLQDVFDVLRLENPDFRVIDNKIRTLLCLIKTLVVRAVMIENGNQNKDPEIGKYFFSVNQLARRNFNFQKQCIDDIEEIRSRFGHELGSLDLIFEKLASMLSSPLMMDHVRSYYQNQSLQILKTETQPVGNRSQQILNGKYIKRTRKRRNKTILVTPLIRKRDSEEYDSTKKIINNSNVGSQLKLVLTKEHQNNQGLGKFSLKRVS
jgi:hypothetical protein